MSESEHDVMDNLPFNTVNAGDITKKTLSSPLLRYIDSINFYIISASLNRLLLHAHHYIMQEPMQTMDYCDALVHSLLATSAGYFGNALRYLLTANLCCTEYNYLYNYLCHN